ncbi:hypothetical protein V6N13_005315 [Hibiscus sabdariffa]
MGDSACSEQIDWRKLFVAASDKSLDFFPLVVSEDGVTITSPADVFDEGLQAWKYALVGQFVERAPNFSVLQKLAGILWGKHGDVERGLSYIASAIGIPLYMDSVAASKQRLAYAKVCVEISIDSKLPRSVKVLLRNGSSAWVDVDTPGCRLSAVTVPYLGILSRLALVRCSLQRMGGLRGSSNQFAVLAEAAALVLKGVDQVGTSTLAVVSEVGTEVPVVSPIVQQEGVSIYADVEVVFVPAQLTVENTVLDDHSSDQPVEQQVLMVEHVVNDVEPVISPKKTRVAALGVTRLVQDMKNRKKDQVDKVKKKALVIASNFIVAKRRELEVAQLVNFSNNISSSSVGRVQELRDELLQLEAAERSFYQQRAKVKWLCESDQSTKYFYSMVKVKNRKHAITSLVSEAGLKLDTQEEIVAEVVHVFSRLLGTSDPNVFVPSIGILEELISSSLSIGEADSLIREILLPGFAIACGMWLDLESIRVVVIIRDVDTHFVLVATPRHVMAGEVGFHDVVPAVMDRMAEDFGLDLQARGHDGCDHIMAVRQQGRGHKLAFMRCTVRIFDKIKAAGR